MASKVGVVALSSPLFVQAVFSELWRSQFPITLALWVSLALLFLRQITHFYSTQSFAHASAGAIQWPTQRSRAERSTERSDISPLIRICVRIEWQSNAAAKYVYSCAA